jgi:hypothetical protein
MLDLTKFTGFGLLPLSWSIDKNLAIGSKFTLFFTNHKNQISTG